MHPLGEAGLGFFAALLTSIPMLGPVVLLLFSAGVELHAGTSVATRPVRALAVGAALAEGVHVALVVFGLAPTLLARPEIAVWLRLVAGLALLGLAWVAWRARQSERPLAVRTPARAFLLGVTLVLLNPGFLVTWVAVVAALAGSLAPGATWGLPFVIGAVLGVLGWFAIVQTLAKRCGPRLHARLTQVRAVVALGLAGLGAWLVIAALMHA